MSYIQYYEDQAQLIIDAIGSGDFDFAESMAVELSMHDFPSEIWDSVIDAFEDAGHPFDDSPF